MNYLSIWRGFVIFYVNSIVELLLHCSTIWRRYGFTFYPITFTIVPNTLSITFASSSVCFWKACRMPSIKPCVVWRNEYQHKICSWKYHRNRQQVLKQLCLSLIICGIQYQTYKNTHHLQQVQLQIYN